MLLSYSLLSFRFAAAAVAVSILQIAGLPCAVAQTPHSDTAQPKADKTAPDQSVKPDVKPIPIPGETGTPVIELPANVDPGMAKPAPNPGMDHTPIIKPPPNEENPAVPK